MKSAVAREAMQAYVLEGGSLPRCNAPWQALPELLEKRFAAAAALNASNWVDAYDHLSSALSTFTQILENESAWCIPAFLVVCTDVRLLAEQADEQLRAAKQKVGKLEEAERILKRGFTTTNNDRRDISDGSRRIGTLGVINQLLKVYFRLNNLRLCANLTRAVNAPNFPSFEIYPRKDRITYRYYSGRLHLYEDRYREAVDDLSYAIEKCPANAIRNRRQIMLYLIPAKILTGCLPTSKILNTYRMVWYAKISAAIRTGNLQEFEECMEVHEELFIRKGLFLAVEKMRPLVYRSLVRAVSKIHGEMYPKSSNKVPLNEVIRGFAVCEQSMVMDEVECIVANLIYHGYIKGYLSHKIGYLVLSKKNPFPRVEG